MNKSTNKNKKKYTYTVVAMLISLMLALTGCGAAEASTASGDTQTISTSQETTQTTAASKSEMFTERDLSGEYNESEAAKITLSGTTASAESGSETSADGVSIDGGTITISAEGVYVVSGTLTDGMIIVDADDAAKVQIVLKDAEITSKTSAAIYVKSADKVFVTTAAGTTNVLANGGTFTAIDDSNIDGAVFAKDDITFNGSGTLTVTSPAGHGIVGKDDVKIASGTITITAAKHGIQANDSIRHAEADVTITAGTDGVHVSDDADAEEGTASDSFFYMADGSLTISADDDGIHADAEANIEGGTINVTKSYEGIEALKIYVSGGDIKAVATDDGFNAAGGNSSSSDSTFGSDDWAGGNGGFTGGGFDDGGTDGSIEISGGSVYVQAGGDGLDSNGSLLISGGYTVVCGPTQGDTSVLDYNSTGTITGGTFIATGASGMAQGFSSAENQGLISVSTGNQSAGTTVTLSDVNGNTIAEVTPELDYAVVYVSTADVQQGSTYTLTAGSYSETIDLTDSIYSSIGGGMGGGMHGGMNGEMNGGSPRQINGEDQNGFGGFGEGQQGMENDQGGMMGGPQGGSQNRGGMGGGHPRQLDGNKQNGFGGYGGGRDNFGGGQNGSGSQQQTPDQSRDADTGATQLYSEGGNAV